MTTIIGWLIIVFALTGVFYGMLRLISHIVDMFER